MASAVPPVRQQPVIIGAGPAGCAAAIRLARAGLQPLLLERATGPVDKVCGDFLSADTITQAKSLGVDPLALGAAPVHRMRLVQGRQSVETPLPFDAVGLSRRTFDAALLAQAVQAGASLRTGQAVREIAPAGSTWCIRSDRGVSLEATTVFLATGKHDLRSMPRDGRSAGAVGLKMYYRPAADTARELAGTIELILFPGGYAGVQPVEDGRIVVCAAIRPQALKAVGGWDRLLAEHPHLSARLRYAHPLLSRTLAIAGVPYGYRAKPDPSGVFRLGDQGAVIPSLTGDGMSIALHSGWSAADAWLAGMDAASWQRDLAKTLAPQMRLAGVLHEIALHRAGQEVGMHLARLWPGLLRAFASRTRLRAVGRLAALGPHAPVPLQPVQAERC
ncbi:MAG TPA: FAD-dependent monooxygenase [Rhodopila sp.]|nr:FAD-dependent monooxygenase [Rhodopila sp.]